MSEEEEIVTVHAKSLSERVSVLEERTKPRNKNVVEIFQMYGGLIALAITLLYSWPLGVWEKFVSTPQEKEQSELSSLRNTLLRAAELTVEAGNVQSSIEDPGLRDMAVRAIQNQILLILVNNEQMYSKFSYKLLPEELVMIGLINQSLYRIDEGAKYFRLAAEHHSTSQQLKVEADRQLGKSYFIPSPIQDVEQGRHFYKKSLRAVNGSLDFSGRLMEITVQSEWGFFEMAIGDWKCGVDNVDIALGKLNNIQPILNDGGNFSRLIKSQTAPLVKSSGQTEVGCDT